MEDKIKLNSITKLSEDELRVKSNAVAHYCYDSIAESFFLYNNIVEVHLIDGSIKIGIIVKTWSIGIYILDESGDLLSIPYTTMLYTSAYSYSVSTKIEEFRNSAEFDIDDDY